MHCLHMIVKDEAAIIERCLAAAAPLISCWIICDTGSSDDTRDRIAAFFAARGIPGELHRTTFRTFGQARNDALRAARASALPYDYLLLADADMELVVDGPTAALDGEAYDVVQRVGSLVYDNIRLLRRDSRVEYVGVTHECLPVRSSGRVQGMWFRDHASGANRAGKFERDAAMLADALRLDPSDARSAYYYAQSLRDAGRLIEALAAYRRRAAMVGWPEETWHAAYQVAVLTEYLRRQDVPAAYLAAYDMRPTRAEPLVRLARWHADRGESGLARLYGGAAAAMPMPADRLFVETEAYSCT